MKQQLQEDMHVEDFDAEDDIAALEHYQFHGDAPRLMPDLSRTRQGFLRAMYRGDPIYG